MPIYTHLRAKKPIQKKFLRASTCLNSAVQGHFACKGTSGQKKIKTVSFVQICLMEPCYYLSRDLEL